MEFTRQMGDLYTCANELRTKFTMYLSHITPLIGIYLPINCHLMADMSTYIGYLRPIFIGKSTQHTCQHQMAHKYTFIGTRTHLTRPYFIEKHVLTGTYAPNCREKRPLHEFLSIYFHFHRCADLYTHFYLCRKLTKN